MKTIQLTLFFHLLSLGASYSSTAVWVIPDCVRVNPQTGHVFENSDAYPPDDRWRPEYRNLNSVWRQDGNHNKMVLWGGRNEYLSAQIILERKNCVLSGITIDIDDLKGPETIPSEKNITLFKEWYIEVTRPSEAYIKPIDLGWYPEVLIPLNKDGLRTFGAPFLRSRSNEWYPKSTKPSLLAGYFHSYNSACRSLYKSTIVIQGKTGETDFKHSIPIELEVKDFTLPDEYHFIPSLNAYGQPFRDANRTMEYFQIAHRHRCLCESFNPKPPFQGRGANIKIDWQSYDETLSPFLDGSAFTSKSNYYGPGMGRPIARVYLPFTGNKSWLGKAVPYGDPDHERSYQEVLKQIEQHYDDKGWKETTLVFFINDFDECKTKEGHEWVEYYGKLLWSAGLKDPSRFRYRFDSGALRNISEHIPEWTPDYLIDKLNEINMWVVCGAWKYISVKETATLRQQGKDIWFYFSNTSGEPCIGSCYIDAELIGLRTWPWIGMAIRIDFRLHLGMDLRRRGERSDGPILGRAKQALGEMETPVLSMMAHSLGLKTYVLRSG